VIDVVIVTSNSREVVLDCLANLNSSWIATTCVVDNAGADGSLEAIASAYPRTLIVRLDEPRALSFAYNRGAERGSADFVLFLNDDVFASRNAIDGLAVALEEDKEAVAAAGRLVDARDGSTQLEYQPRGFPTLTTFLASLAGIQDMWPTNPWTGGHLRNPLSETDTVCVDYAPGACVLIRRAAFEAVRGWDERYAFWFEDVDLAWRLRPLGTLLYVPTAVFRHVGGHSGNRLSRAQVVARAYPSTLLYGEKHMIGWRRRMLGLAFAVAGGLKAPLAAKRDPELADAYRGARKAGMRLIFGRTSKSAG
jgi:GT2 family glycosyltransferase